MEYTTQSIPEANPDDEEVALIPRPSGKEPSLNSVLIPHAGDEDAELGVHLRLAPVVSPQRDRLDPIRFYLDIWQSQCLPALPPTLQNLETVLGRSTVVIDIMAALSACRLSRSRPQRKLIRNCKSGPDLSFRPDLQHESFGYERYGAVMHQVALWQHDDFARDSILGLALLVFFCLIAASMGSFPEFRLHSEAVEQFIQGNEAPLLRHSPDLLTAWVNVKMQNWWRRAYFSRPEFHRHHGSLSLTPQLELILDKAGKRSATASVILSESHRIHLAAIVSCRNWEQQVCEEHDTEADHTTKDLSEELYTLAFTVEAGNLDAWCASLPVSELPAPWVSEPILKERTPRELHVESIRFQTHQAAMNFAYYVVARALQCTQPLESLTLNLCPVDLDTVYEETESWILLLLRIAAGLDWKDCVQNNVFTIGIVALLLTGALRSRKLAVGVWAQHWLEERLTGDAFEEGNFPVFQALEVLRLINRERRAGWDVLALFQTVDDGGGKGKCSSYHSQSLTALWVYGRCRASGRLAAYCATI